ncbi:MAG: CRTAC1 family protein [Candidatus Poribacteria bacterium]|nr:CRTAC1 family protein [Candidatus Poribacteria bacterium]
MKPAFASSIRIGCTYLFQLCLFLWFNTADILANDYFRAVETGIQFRHQPGNSGQRYILETVSSGCAFLDYNNDDLLDLYLANGNRLSESTTIKWKNELVMNALYRNNGDGSFTNVTQTAGVGDTGYSIGCGVGDYDNDGWIDLYVTNFQRNTLYRNSGDGSFTDRTRAAGVECSSWSTSCAFLDYDRDSDLDLYVVNYLDFQLTDHKNCGDQLRPDCGPSEYPAASDMLYQNNGDGTFTDVTSQAGVLNPNGKGLGIACGDIDNDGDPDIYIANDDTRNFLYRNNGDGTFSDVTLLAGVGFSEDGEVQGGMGTSFGDYDNDGWLDLIVTNYQDQVNTLYRNDGNGLFSDASYTTLTGPVSYPMVGWGTDFFDYDNDGWLDLFVANGHLLLNVAQFDLTSTYHQPNFLFRNRGDGCFDLLDLGISFNRSSRGTAFGDYDNDGDTDLLILNTDDRPVLLENRVGQDQNWIGLKLVGKTSNRSAIGARVRLTVGKQQQMQEVAGGGSYASGSDLRLLFGLGDAEIVDRIEILWPTGEVETRIAVKSGQYLTIIEQRVE